MSSAERGLTLMEIVIALGVAALLAVVGLNMLKGLGSRSAVGKEADAVADALWDLRSKASTGMPNPCLDFPDAASFRSYSDLADSPDGFNNGDKLLDTHKFESGIRVLSVSGGAGPLHSVCFESEGVLGSASAPLLLVLGRNTDLTRTVSLLPATGMARVR